MSRRKGVATTVQSESATPANDLVKRDFEVSGPDQLWVASRHLCADRRRLPVPVRRPGGCIQPGRRSAEISARGRWPRTCAPSWSSPRWRWRWGSADPTRSSTTRIVAASCTSIAFGKRCERAGVRPSTGQSCCPTAERSFGIESFFATFECELIERERFASHAPGTHGDLLLHRGLHATRSDATLLPGLPRAADLRKTTSRSTCSRKLLTVHENGATPTPSRWFSFRFRNFKLPFSVDYVVRR